MYGLLMLLPQSTAFKTLHARLHSVPSLALLQLEQNSHLTGPDRKQGANENGQAASPFKHLVDHGAMLQRFRQLQVSLPNRYEALIATCFEGCITSVIVGT